LDQEFEGLLGRLEAHPDFRVVRRLDVAGGGEALTGPTVRRAAIVDTETTGTDHATDKVIELAVVVFEYCHATGVVGRVLGSYDGLEDPGVPIPSSSTAIHGITDEMVRGQRIDEASVARVLDGVGLVIAHNAGFDRKFLEPRLPLMASLPWACSWQEVPWNEAGIESSKLEYLAYRYGFFYEGHRAEIDCRALLEVLRRPFVRRPADRADACVTQPVPGLRPSGPPAAVQESASAILVDGGRAAVPGGVAQGERDEAPVTALKVLLDSARGPSFRVWATGSPFESKDVLRKRGYWWDAPKRCWSVEVRSQEAVQAELQWLKEAVFGGKGASVEIETLDARVRWSGRAGKRERVSM
jgi:DNA polymerase-3 subunit epsilon